MEQSKHKHDSCFRRPQQGMHRLFQWLVFGAGCSFPPPRDSIRNVALFTVSACCPCQGHVCFGLTASSCSCRAAAEGMCGIAAHWAEEEQEHTGGFEPARFGRKWLMALDCFCTSTKLSMNISTAIPKRPEGFTGASIWATFLLSLTYPTRSALTTEDRREDPRLCT